MRKAFDRRERKVNVEIAEKILASIAIYMVIVAVKRLFMFALAG